MSKQQSIPPPHWSLSVSDGPRALVEISILAVARIWLRRKPRGDGHPVIVIPGFCGSDNYNWPLIRYLSALGYQATGWNQGRNIGTGSNVLRALHDRVATLSNSGRQRVSLIGHSLGGIHAREFARQHPERVRQVITLGSPIGEGRRNAARADRLYRLINRGRGESSTLWPVAPPVPTTTIYSREDGIVNWRISFQYDGHERTENVEVHGSHVGLTFNPLVWELVADRLSQADGEWQPFQRSKCRRFVFPEVSAPARECGARDGNRNEVI